MTDNTQEAQGVPTLTDEERAEAESEEALIYHLSVALMRLDGDDGDPHHLLMCGGVIPEPWGDAWQRYEDQARKVLVGAREARTMYELPGVPIRVEGLVPSNGAIDPALYGYIGDVTHNAKALSLVTVA